MIPNSRIVVIGDQADRRERYGNALKQFDQLLFINSYPNERLERSTLLNDNPDIIVLDVAGTVAFGGKGIMHLRRIIPSVKILLLVPIRAITSKSIVELFSAGALGIINRDADDFDVTSAILKIRNGGAPISIPVATALVTSFHRNPRSPLTYRESEIMNALAGGKSYESIAGDMNISMDTVKTHVRHIFCKLQVNNKSDAIEKARIKNLI